MVDPIAYAIIGVALALALVAGIAWRRGKEVTIGQAVLGGLVELAVLVQGVVAVVKLSGGEEPKETALFIGYLTTTALIIPAALYWARFENSKWASAVLAMGGVVVAALVLRLQQIWGISA